MKTNTQQIYDLAIIGAGSAGFSAAITAAEKGFKVAMIGYGMIGGTCVNVGCVPSKTMIRAVEILHQSKTASRFKGIQAEAGLIDWQTVVQQKNELVKELRQAKYIDLLSSYPEINYIKGRAEFTDGQLTVDGNALQSKKILIANGSTPSLPKIDGIDNVDWLTSTTALELETLPKSLIVMGAGYIGVEMAQIFARAGCHVTLVCRTRLLPEAAPEISEAMTKCFQDEGISVRDKLSYQSIKQAASGIHLKFSSAGVDDTLKAEKILLTTGRRPNTDTLNLKSAGIKQTPNGGIKINDQMQTSNENIYAAGDVTGDDQFVYMAAYGARVAVNNAFGLSDMRYDNRAMPWVVFSDPQVAGVGLSEAAAKQAGYDAITSIITLDYVPRALAARDTRGLIKLVGDKKSGRLLGAEIMAPEGADSIQTAAIAIQQNMTVQQLADTIFPYLTTVEGLKLAAQTFNKDVTKLSCCAG